MSDLNTWWAIQSFKLGSGTRRRVWLKLAKLLENGVPILKALETLQERRIRLKSRNDPMAVAYDNWARGIRNGKRFSECLRGWIGTEELMLISAGDQSGKLEASLRSAVRLIEANKTINSALLGGITYPFILVLLSIGVMYLFGYKIIPGFSKIVSEDKWTGVAASMVSMSKFTQTWLPIVGAGLVVLCIAFFVSLPRFDGPLRVALDKYPPYSVYRTVKGSTWMIAFAALVEAGMRAEYALESLSSQSSLWMRRRIDACLEGMRSGYNVGDSLARAGHDFPDAEVIDDLSVYSSLSSFDQALSLIGKEMLEDSVEKIRGAMKVIFNAGLVLVASLLSWMIGGLLAMQTQMTQVMQSTMH